MKDKVIELLTRPKTIENIKELSLLCNIHDFQSSNLFDEYKELYTKEVDLMSKGLDASNFSIQKGKIITGLTSGEYSKEEVYLNDLKREIIKLLTKEKTTETILALNGLTNIDENTISNLIDKYQNIEKNELEMMKNGLDTSKEKWNIINSLMKN